MFDNAKTNTTAAPTPTPPDIREAVSVVEQMIDRLAEKLDVLGQKLSAVSNDHYPPTPVADARSGQCQISQQLYIYASRIEALGDAVQSQINRLEV